MDAHQIGLGFGGLPTPRLAGVAGGTDRTVAPHRPTGFWIGEMDGKPPSQRAQRRGGMAAPPMWRVPLGLLPKVAIVGRPNVGKSALFNRITGTNDAIVFDTPGVTRDRRYTRALWGGREFMCIDTGGLQELPGDATGSARLSRAERAALAGGAEILPGMIEQQAAAAVEEAVALVVVADGQAGPTSADGDILAWLRRFYPHKPIVLAVNKCESPVRGVAMAAAFYEIGGAEPIAVSAISSTGVGELLDALVARLPAAPDREQLIRADAPEAERPLRVAIVGRPNVGKSSLLNCLAGEVRSIVHNASGTTTDAIDTDVTDSEGRRFSLIDTAGIRKRAKVAKGENGTEELSVERALRAIKRAEVCALVVDAVMGATEQDFRIADRAVADGAALVMVVNKWDTVPDKDGSTMSTYESNLRTTMRSFPWAPVVFTTATTGQRTQQILSAAAAVGLEHARRVSTGTLNQVRPPVRPVRPVRRLAPRAPAPGLVAAAHPPPGCASAGCARRDGVEEPAQPGRALRPGVLRHAGGHAAAHVCVFRQRPEAVPGVVPALPGAGAARERGLQGHAHQAAAARQGGDWHQGAGGHQRGGRGQARQLIGLACRRGACHCR